MVSIDINGTVVEAETLKAAQRLARKEEKRQAKIHNESEKNRDIARKYAWAEVGRLACNEHARIWLYLTNQHPNLVRHDRGQNILKVQGENETAEWRSYKSVDAVLMHMSDVVYGARFSEMYEGKELIDWCFFGLYRGELVCTAADCLDPRLEKMYQEAVAMQQKAA